MEATVEQKLSSNSKEVLITEPGRIFSCRGIHYLYGHGLDPTVDSKIKLMIKDVNNAQIVYKTDSSPSVNGARARMPLFKLYHRFIVGVKVTGFIVAIQIKERFTIYTLDDSSGTVNCKLWSNASNNHKWQIGEWVKIEGKLNYFMQSMEINIDLMDSIVDPNEELLHWLESHNIVENVLKKAIKYPIQPPVIHLSNNAQILLSLLYSSKIEQFQFNQLLSNHKHIQQFVKNITSDHDTNTKDNNEKQIEMQCLFKLRDIIRELTRLEKLKLIDLRHDIYIVCTK